MAHHQQTNHDRSRAAQASSTSSGPDHPSVRQIVEEDEAPSEGDEPPESIRFAKRVTPSSQSSHSDNGCITSPHYRTASLLTQALLTSPELTPLSDTEAPVLTSDGSLTSPARTSTPSPPVLPVNHIRLAMLGPKSSALSHEPNTNPAQMPQVVGIDPSQETKVEESLGRRRCISFACGRQAPSHGKVDLSQTSSSTVKENSEPPANPMKRPCMLRFACPTKPSRSESREDQTTECALNNPKESQNAKGLKEIAQVPPAAVREHQTLDAPIMNTQTERVPSVAAVSQPQRTPAFNRVDFQKSEVTRFHEFAGPFTEDDEWTKEQTVYRQKITISDTLRKENAFRKLGEEAEEEDALEEDADAYGNEDELEDDDEEDELDVSDGGNETDDESGFAESDDESDGDPRYRFWTPGLTTAATSTDHLEDHLLQTTRRTASESSVESVVDLGNLKLGSSRLCSRKKTSQNASGSCRIPSMRPGTPELPDSGDFVIGTIDEDRPLEDAYMSCLEQRKRSKHRLIPQDIDPSFPTSDFEAEDDQDDEDDNEEDNEDEEGAAQTHSHREWTTYCPDSSDEEGLSNRRQSSVGALGKSSVPSPRRLHSPPPRRLFGQPTHRLRSPPPMHRKLISPPSSRRPSLNGSPSTKSRGVHIAHLAQRPNLTHTTSLPRTPNPFWGLHRNSRLHGYETPSAGTSPKTMAQIRSDPHSRGPIDIVQGLETKRQRRKEKFWRQHCRNAQAGKEKERKHQPGKGVERMRELGLEMAVRFKGYNQKANLVLSV